MDFSEIIVVYDLKLVTHDWSDKKFLLTSRLCSLRLYAPCLGAIYAGCSESSWNLVIKVSNIDIILSFFDISQVGINELTSSS